MFSYQQEQYQKQEKRNKFILQYLLAQTNYKISQKGIVQMDQQQIKDPSILQAMQNMQKVKKQMKQSYNFLEESSFVCDYQSEFTFMRNKIHCKYNNKIVCLYLCCAHGCQKYAGICGDDNCKCKEDHLSCKFMIAKNLLIRLDKKILRKPPLSFQLYIQGKLCLLDYMMDKISKEKFLLEKWIRALKKRQGELEPFYLFKSNHSRPCYLPRVGIGKQQFKRHRFCGCNGIKLSFQPKGNLFFLQQNGNQKQVLQQQYIQKLKSLYKQKCNAFGIIIDAITQKIQEITQLQAKSYTMNFAQYQICKYFMEADGLLLYNKQFAIPFNGNTVYVANQLQSLNIYNQQDFPHISKNQSLFKAKVYYDSQIFLSYEIQNQKMNQITYFTIQHLRKMWKIHAQKIFSTQIQGSAFHVSQWLLPIDLPKKRNFNDYTKSLDQLFDCLGNTTYFQNKKMKIIYFVSSQKWQKKLQSNKTLDQLQILNNQFPNKKLYNSLNRKSFNLIKIMSSFLNINSQDFYTFKYARFEKPSFSSILKGHKLNPQKIQKQLQDYDFIKNCRQQVRDYQQVWNNLEQSQKFIQFRYFKNYNSIFSHRSFAEYIYDAYKKFQKCTVAGQKSIYKQYKSQQQYPLNLVLNTYFKNKYFSQSIYINSKQRKEQKINQIILKIIENNPCVDCLKIRGNQWSASLWDNYMINNLQKTYLSKIKQLYLNHMIGKYSVLFLKNLKNIKILDLTNYLNQNQIQWNKTIKHMTYLEQLTLKNSHLWVNNQFTQIIKKMTQLKLLNIKKTFINGQGLKNLDSLKKLKTLICGYPSSSVKIQIDDILYLAKHCRQINKVSAKYLSYKEFSIQNFWILNNRTANGLTHLDLTGINDIQTYIRPNYVLNQDLLQMQNLRFILIIKEKIKEENKRILKQKGIILYQVPPRIVEWN